MYCHIRSMSSQSVTMPCSSGYRIFNNPLNSCARFPMKASPSRPPASTLRCFGRPTKDGKKHRGKSSPAYPARMVPLPLSITMGALWRSAISSGTCERRRTLPYSVSGRMYERRLRDQRKFLECFRITCDTSSGEETRLNAKPAVTFLRTGS